MPEESENVRTITNADNKRADITEEIHKKRNYLNERPQVDIPSQHFRSMNQLFKEEKLFESETRKQTHETPDIAFETVQLRRPASLYIRARSSCAPFVQSTAFLT